MVADNHRKEGKPEAKTEGSEESSAPLLNSAIVTKAERSTPILPSHYDTYIAKIENVVEDCNIREAIKAVKRNKGAPGVDGITTREIDEVMRKVWPQIKQDILEGKYRPNPVKRVEIPKPDGKGVRQLGIPTVMDRVIQQALLQELVPVFEPIFSQYSYGFRPKRSAQQAVLQAHKYIQEGYEWVVDIDLEKFFDTVNHDKLMAKIARRIRDKKILLLIRRYLQAGIMENGLVKPAEQGTPQGGPLSPLLSNIMLDEFDREMEKRGLRFSRYADDCNIYVKTERSGRRVMETATRYITQKLRLKVNQQKSAVDRPWNRKFLGFTFTETKGPNRIVVHESRSKRLKDKIRGLTKRMRGSKIPENIRKRIMPITRGWANYFGIAEGNRTTRNLDGWIRRKIRCILWRQWKKPYTRYKRLVALGLTEKTAWATIRSGKGPWHMARSFGVHKALSNGVIEAMGYTTINTMMQGRLEGS